jgi:nucleoside-diphosphate-sugar epimerase
MKILITGNMGYIGPHVVNRLRATFPDCTLIGYDMGYFGASLTNTNVLPERELDIQIYGDVRNMTPKHLEGVDAVVHLSAISNDAMGSRFEDVTMEVNHLAGINIAKMAKAAGARAFVFASSCSMYGFADGPAKKEDSSLNPLTAYARSKAATEVDLAPIADENFTITCLRFATACGMSPRLRLDLVINDFVAGAVASGKITILSDGTPWRPLIHVKDMAKAIEWAINRSAEDGGEFLAVNAGSNDWNFQVKDIAQTVADSIPGVQVSLNKDAVPDKRSYKVNFDLFASLAPNHQPEWTLQQTIEELIEGLNGMGFANGDFRESNFMRLKLLTSLQDEQLLNKDLQWTTTNQTINA